MKNFIFTIDHAVAKLFHELYLLGGDAITNIMEFISFIAEAGILFLAVGIGLALFKRTRKIGAVVLGGVAIGFILTNVVLKNIIERARPFENINSDFYKWWLSAGATAESGFSFPSGHTTATTAFAMTLFLTTDGKYSWPVLFLPILMACSRIYLMVHFFSDCLGGFVVGTISALLAYLIVKWIYKTNIKFFVWIRELNLFKTKQKASYPKNTQTQNKENKPSEDTSNDYVYTTQADEKTNSNIKQDNSNDNQKNNKDSDI